MYLNNFVTGLLTATTSRLLWSLEKDSWLGLTYKDKTFNILILQLIKSPCADSQRFPLICNSSNDIVSGTFYSEKVDHEVFYYKDILQFFLKLPKYYTYKKSYLGTVAL
jgi:hypothetical protein